MSTEDKLLSDPKTKTFISYAQDWGKSSVPPTLLATLIASLHARPFRMLPMTFPPVLLFSSYLNLSDYPVDAAGITAAWSGLYLLLARRRKVAGINFSEKVRQKFGARGIIRASAMVLSGVNVVGCGITYGFGKRKEEEEDTSL